MEIRKPFSNEKNTMISLWKYCFNNDSDKFIKHYFQNIYNEKNALVVYDKGEILSAIQLNPYFFSIDGKLIETKYLVGISSFPESRGKKAVNLLFNEIFRKQYTQKTPFIILMAIDYGLYEPFGFAHVYDKYIIKGTLKSLNQKIDDKGNFYSLSAKSDKKILKKVMVFYNDILKKTKRIYCSRKIDNFKNVLSELEADHGFAYYLEENQEIKGYILYYFNKNDLVIKEILYQDSNDLQKILKFLFNHNTQFDGFEIREDNPELLNEFVVNRRELKTEIMPFLTIRITNLLELFKKIDFGKYFKQTFKLKVIDKQILENNAVFIFEKNKDIAKFENDDPEGNDPDMEIDISLLTQLIFNYLDSESALKFVNKYTVVNSVNQNIFFDIFEQKKNIYFNEYV